MHASEQIVFLQAEHLELILVKDIIPNQVVYIWTESRDLVEVYQSYRFLAQNLFHGFTLLGLFTFK